jgi:hypothetical protein
LDRPAEYMIGADRLGPLERFEVAVGPRVRLARG